MDMWQSMSGKKSTIKDEVIREKSKEPLRWRDVASERTILPQLDPIGLGEEKEGGGGWVRRKREDKKE